MQTQKLSLFPRLFLVTSLMISLFINQPAGAATPGTPDGSPVKAASASLPQVTIPNSLMTIPEVAAGVSPTLDGSCSQTEYNGVNKSFPDGGGGTGYIYLVHDADFLYVCIVSPAGTYSTRFDSLYLDPKGDGPASTYAQQDDFSLRLDFAKFLKTSMRGNGLINGWQDTSTADNSLWNGASTTNANGDTAEYALPLQNFNINVCSTIFRLAGYHHWFAGIGNDYGWPSNQYFDQPGTWQPMQLSSANCTQHGSIAYVYRSNADDANSFNNLLTSAGYTVTLVPLSAVTSTDFSLYDMTIIADDTGSLNDWGTPPGGLSGTQVAQIKAPNKPILGLGEGGYAFFGQLSLYIGWPRGWHGPQDIMNQAATAPAGYFDPPTAPVTHYSTPFNSVGIYLPPKQSVPADVTPIGLENPLDDHSPLITQDCRTLWGNSGNPLVMTSDGKLLFLHTVSATHATQCAVPPKPDVTCRQVVKTADPVAGTAVVPGQVITYTITYTYSSDKACNNNGDAKIVDSIPFDTLFVPGSASGGISPGGDGSLTWSVTPGSGTGTETFQATVSDTQCVDQHTVNNQASLQASGYAPVTSNVVSHPVTCPPVGFPNTQPPYTEDELQVQPYPLVAGHSSQVSVSLTNSGASAADVTVQFQVNPTGIGIGLPYSTFDTRTATIPAHSQIIVTTSYLPAASGQACFQVTVTAAGYTPIKTQSCLDTTEDFSGSPPYPPLVFSVGNPTGSTADITLVVDNTCPGWSAAITNPASGVLTGVGANDSDLRSASLQVNPPSPATLGSGCHIDVQGWIIDPATGAATLIGGIRKLDIAPVHLPAHTTPSWEEPEITFNPDPPVAGVAGQVCILLNNPLSIPKLVTVNFSVADFGAGIPFVPAVSLTGITLPANTLATYCAPWTPAVGGTLHRCVYATLVQAGYLDQHSQHNVDIVHPVGNDLSGLVIPFIFGNPGSAGRALRYDINPVGLDPAWVPVITLPGGGPPPASLAPGGPVALELHFTLASPAALVNAATLPQDYSFGSTTSVQVTELLDGFPESGFTVLFHRLRIYFPLIVK